MNSDQHARGDRRPPNRCSYIYIYSICDVGAALFLHVHTDIKTHTSMHACVNTYIYIQARDQETKNRPGHRSWGPPPTRPVCMHLCVRGHAHKHTCDLMGDKDGKLSIDSTCTPNCLSHFVAEERPQDKCTPHGQVHFIPHTGNTPGHAQ